MLDKTGQVPEIAATLDSGGRGPILEDNKTTEYAAGDQHMNPEPANLKRAGGRFAYATGSKPLDGYTIKRGIGVGGFGEVYFALSDAGKEVALKRIQRNMDVELRGVQNCLNLKNINLITLWDIRTNDAGESWVVMEYVPGPSLRDIIEDFPTGMPHDQIQRWFCSTSAGVAYLHDQGIVHRDLKPANIFLDDDENVIKIGDYGLSKFISCSRRSGQTETVGTFHYMAPEIGKGIYGKEIDIYALGIVLYEMLTGDVPFVGESSQEIIMKHLTADPDLTRVPETFQPAIRKALKKDPDHRFSSIEEFLGELPWEIFTAEKMSRYVSPPRKQPKEPMDTPANSVKATIGSATVRIIGDGISFGPLRDTNAGTRSKPQVKQPEIQFIDPSDSPATDHAHSIAGDEPIAKAVHSGWQGVASWWNNTAISTPIRLGALAIVGMVIVKNSQWLLPLGLALGLVYLIYFAVRMWMLSGPEPSGDATQPPRVSKREVKKQTTANVRTFLSARDRLDWLSELVGSLLIAAVTCVIFNLFGMAVGGTLLESTVESWAIYAWSTTVTILASWAILAASKCWEHQEGDQWLRRLTMLVLGTLVGGVAFIVDNSLNLGFAGSQFVAEQSIFGAIHSGLTQFPIYLLYFSLLFGAVRWWKKADPIRRTRLSVISVGIAIVWAALFTHMLAFIPVWGCILAVIVSVAVQLSAPWLHPDRRSAINLEVSNSRET